jgi:Site-specific recombinase XerD
MTGSLQIKNNKFYAVINTVDNFGKRKQKWFSTGLPAKNNKRQAQAILNDLLANYEEKQKVTSDVLFTDWVKQWLEHIEPTIDPVTFDHYNRTARTHVISSFEDIKLSDITKSILQKHFDEKAKNGRKDGKGGLAVKSLQHIRLVISLALKYAIECELIDKNPCVDVKLPKKEYHECNFYNAKQLNELFRCIADEEIHPLVRFCATYGLRRSELLGLKWDSIDFDNNTITIKHTVVPVTGKIVEKNKTKTTKSRRTFPLLPDLGKMLCKIKEQQEEHKAFFKREYIKTDYIFTRANGEPYKPNFLSNKFSKLLKKHSLPHIRFHDLRHSSASLLIAQGFTIKDVQEWLGHASITTTANIYTHIDMTRKQEIGNKVLSALSC